MSGFQAKMSQEVKSLKTNSRFIAEGTKEKAFLVVNGEAFETVVWRARMLARDF